MKRPFAFGRLFQVISVRMLQALLVLAAAQRYAAAEQPTGDALSGKKLFLQRCSVCHLPSPWLLHDPELPTYGPKLEGYVRDQQMEAAARAIISNGTARMPGFQYGLTPAEINQIIAYMKVFKLSEFVRPGKEVAGGPDVEVPATGPAGETKPAD